MAEPGDAARMGRDGFEARDVRPLRVVLVGLALGAGAGLLALLLLGFNQLLEAVVEDSPRGPLAGIDRAVPEPRLQPAPALELEELQARWQLALESYGWVDREAGIARIPIERAMTILAERGWPNPVEGPPAVEAPPAAGASDDSGGAR